jgi:primase-polymerase (primpol)-like protein
MQSGQSQPVSALGLSLQTPVKVPKKVVSSKDIKNSTIIRNIAKKQETPKTIEQYNKILQAEDLAKSKINNKGKTITVENKKTGTKKTYEYDKDPA